MLLARTKIGTCLLLVAAGLLFLPAGITVAADHSQHGGAAHSMQQASQDKPDATVASQHQPAGDPYLLDKDVVSGQKIDQPVIITFQGRELRFASEDSVKTFKAAPARYLTKIDQEMVKQQLPYYPLDKCVVSGEALGGSMGEPINYVYKNQLVRFCCEMCKAKFDKDPAKYLAKIDEAVIAKQKDAYALQACPISGEKLGAMDKPVDYVAGSLLVRFCCPSCIAKFNKDPLPTLAKLQGGVQTVAADHAAAGRGQHDQSHMH